MSINHGFPSRTYLNPVGNCIVGPGYNPNVFLGPDNLFGRSDVHAAAIGRHILRRADTLSLQDYQLWAQDSWKAEHGSPEAARRFANKLIEEHEEYNLALQNYLYEASDQNADDLVSEAGDVLWCLTSGLSNASESLEDSVQHYLFNLIKGTVIIQDGRPRNPSWRRKAISVATKNIRPVQTRDIDAMFAAGYIPQPSANMNLLEGEETEREEFRDDLRHRWIMTLSLLFTMSKLMHRQFGIHERFDDFLPQEIRSAEDHRAYGAEIRHVAPFIMMETLYTTRRLVGATMGDIILKNYEKISGRVAANLIDKTDGER